MAKKSGISISVIKRLPRYYRFIGELVKQGTVRISSGELAEKMSLTASQIRQDLNCFGGFGQQGYVLKGSRIRGKEICNFKQDKEVILVIGGSLGAKNINDEVRYHINEILKNFNVIHICGKGNLDKALEGLEGYKQFEYVKEDLQNLLKYAEFIISSAGANVIF